MALATVDSGLDGLRFAGCGVGLGVARFFGFGVGLTDCEGSGVGTIVGSGVGSGVGVIVGVGPVLVFNASAFGSLSGASSIFGGSVLIFDSSAFGGSGFACRSELRLMRGRCVPKSPAGMLSTIFTVYAGVSAGELRR